MSLLERLLAIELPPSHHAVSGNVLDLVGKVIAYIEHGEELFDAAEKDAEAIKAGEPASPPHVDQLLSPESELPGSPVDAAAAPVQAAAPAPSETPEERVARLQQELAAAEAAANRTVAAPPEPVPPAPASPAPAEPGLEG